MSGVRMLSLVGVAAMVATGCNSINLEKFAEQTIPLKAVSANASAGTVDLRGELTFENTTYFTAYRQVCDTVLCGTHDEYQCRQREVCDYVELADAMTAVPPGHPGGGFGPHPSVPAPHPVPAPGPGDHHGPGPGDHHGPGPGDHHGPGPGDHHGPGPGDHHGPGPGDHNPRPCHIVQDCGFVPVPTYCQENCRQEPYTDSRTDKTVSPISVRLNGVPNGDAKLIKDLVVAVKTNQNFVNAMDNPSLRPKKMAAVFNGLNRTDRTLVGLQAKDLELVSKAQFMPLPADFRAGDPISIELSVSSGGGKDACSAVGTDADVPQLHTVTNQ